LLFLIKPLLHALLVALVLRGEALAELVLRLQLDGAGRQEEHLRPAAPTLEAVQVLDLIRLRLEARGLAAGVVQIELTAQGVPATQEQLRLFTGKPRRDLELAHRALARLRAEFGDEAVVRARLRDGHFPEASFAWEPLAEVACPRPGAAVPRTLVRRILARPVPLPRRQLPPKLRGPYVVSGGWWAEEVHRDYYFAETPHGDFLWVYFDRRRRQWFLQGRVE
jgi:protein ImuB